MSECVETVTAFFEKLGAGDLPGALAFCTEDVVLHFPGPKTIPHAGSWHGRRGLADFFHKVHDALEVESFSTIGLLGEGEVAVVLGTARMTPRATGRSYEEHWVLVFQVKEGRITELREHHDTAAIAEAFREA